MHERVSDWRTKKKEQNMHPAKSITSLNQVELYCIVWVSCLDGKRWQLCWWWEHCSSSSTDFWGGKWSATVTCLKGKMPFKITLTVSVLNSSIQRLPGLHRMNKHTYPAPVLQGNVCFSFPFNSLHCSLRKHLNPFWKVSGKYVLRYSASSWKYSY